MRVRRGRGSRPFAPLVAVIAAFNEAENLPAVLTEIPEAIGEEPFDVLVVDECSTDDTAMVREHGAALLRLERNCGDGVALRAGYRIAWNTNPLHRHPRRRLQWDLADLPGMVRLVASGDATSSSAREALGAT